MKKFLTIMPAIALGLVLTACGKLPQPAVPETPKSVEKAMEAAISEDKAMTTDEEVMEAGELSEEDVTVEIDATLDGLENDLDAALEAESGEATTVETDVEVETETTEQIESPAVTDAEEETAEQTEEEEEIIDEPIIIE